MHKKINRAKEIDRRRQRKAKLANLRTRYLVAKNDAERKEIYGRVTRISPWLTVEEFASPNN